MCRSCCSPCIGHGFGLFPEHRCTTAQVDLTQPEVLCDLLYSQVHKKARCPVSGCKEKLSTINTYHCKTCGQRVCLKHRHGDDHNCEAAKVRAAAAAAAQRAQGSVFGKLQAALRPASAGAVSSAQAQAGTSGRAPTQSPAAARAAAQAQYSEPGNTLQGTAHRRMQNSASAGSLHTPAARQQQGALQQPTHPPPQPNPVYAPPTITRPAQPVSNANPLVPPHLPEECPQVSSWHTPVMLCSMYDVLWH